MVKIVIASLLMGGGLFFFLVGTVGILRLPDALTRAHGAAKCDTLGAVLCLGALVIFNGFNGGSIKLILAILFLWIGNPTATHLISKGIIKANINNEKDNLLRGTSNSSNSNKIESTGKGA